MAVNLTGDQSQLLIDSIQESILIKKDAKEYHKVAQLQQLWDMIIEEQNKIKQEKKENEAD